MTARTRSWPERMARRTARMVLDALGKGAAELLWALGHIRAAVGPSPGTRLHVGCGKNRFKDWINADIVPGADSVVFMERKLPFRSATLDRVYSEHVLEHVSQEIGVRFLKEVHRVLRPGGVVRIAMPDLDDLVADYVEDWRRQDWVHWPGHEEINTRGRMINAGFRWWGHQFLYNREDLAAVLAEAGFTHVETARWGESGHADLANLETRVESKLVVEATKT